MASKAEKRKACNDLLYQRLGESGLPEEIQKQISDEFSEQDGNDTITMIFEEKDLMSAIEREQVIIEEAKRKEAERASKAEKRKACNDLLYQRLGESGLPEEIQKQISDEFSEQDGGDTVTMIFEEKELMSAIEREQVIISEAKRKEAERATKVTLAYGKDIQDRLKDKTLEIDKTTEKLLQRALKDSELTNNPIVVSFSNKEKELVVVFHDGKRGAVKVTVNK